MQIFKENLLFQATNITLHKQTMKNMKWIYLSAGWIESYQLDCVNPISRTFQLVGFNATSQKKKNSFFPWCACVKYCLSFEKEDFPWKFAFFCYVLHDPKSKAFYLTFCVFWSSFRTQAVNSVSDFVVVFWFVCCCF